MLLARLSAPVKAATYMNMSPNKQFQPTNSRCARICG
jgi:hypothetical protein